MRKVSRLQDDNINILIPMAGLGSRFLNAGYTTPKPLIDIYGEPMISWAMKSFNFLSETKSYQLIFIILEEHEKEYHMSLKLKKLFGNSIKIITLTNPTRGQAETCLAAKKFINNNHRLFIYNCDTYSISDIWKLIQQEDPDGIIPYFESSDPRYSFVAFDEFNYICEVAEKRAISTNATVGMYYFKHGKDFVNAAEMLIEKNVTQNGEYYVLPCYEMLLASGKRLRGLPVSEYNVFGTPEELNSFIKRKG